MSKYIAIIDLPDDGKCDRCAFSDEHCCRETGHWFRRGNYDRPTDCPLIPVDRVIWKMNYLNDQENITGGQATAWCERVLRDELGVTE